MELKNETLKIEKETAFKLMDCRKDNPLYEEMENLYEEIWNDFQNILHPAGVLDIIKGEKLGFVTEEGKETQYGAVIYTLGEEISNYIEGLFSQGEYLKGTLADAMADACLFAMEKEWKPELWKMCRKKNLGVKKRLESSVDFPAELHKKLLDLLNGEELGLSLTSGFMFSPVKTCCYLFLLTDDCSRKEWNHDCGKCPDLTCRLRKSVD